MPYITTAQQAIIDDLVSRTWGGSGGPQSALRKLHSAFLPSGKVQVQPKQTAVTAAAPMPKGKATIATSPNGIAGKILETVHAETARLQKDLKALAALAATLQGSTPAIDTEAETVEDTTATMFPRGTGRRLAHRSINQDGTPRKRRKSVKRSRAMREAWARRKAAASVRGSKRSR